jgi:rhomboid protease GluP
LEQPPDEQWHYERDGRYVGPLDRAALSELIRQKVIGPNTLVCRGGGDWIPAKKSDLFDFKISQKSPWIGILAMPFVVILLANIAVFVLMALSGVSIVNPAPKTLLLWGADYGPKTTSGEWWRLLTSTFVHIGLVHVVFNMFVYIRVAPIIQAMLGRAGFTTIYFVSGIAGSLTSLIWNPYVVSAGASGAIFGLYGALLGYALVQHGKLKSALVVNLAGYAVVFIAYNVIYGMVREGTDMAAHFGGLGAGFISGMCLSFGNREEGSQHQWRRSLVVAGVSAALMIAVALRIPHTVDLQATLAQFGKVEDSALTKFNAAIGNFKTGKLKPNDFANLVEKDVLPDWNAEYTLIRQIKGLPARQDRIVTTIAKYMELRRDGWSEMIEGARQNLPGKIQGALKKEKEADKVVQEMGKLAKPQ